MMLVNDMNKPQYITDYLVHNSELWPDKPAIIFGERVLTWSELLTAVARGAAYLSMQLPREEQAIVGILLPTSPDFIIAYLSVLHAGHIAMPLDIGFKALEIQAVADQMQPMLVITDSEHQALPGLHPTVLVDALLAADDIIPESPFLRLSPDTQVATLLFTSGTTGKPKSVPCTHTSYLWNAMTASEIWRWTSDDTLLVSLPLSHWHGLVLALGGIVYHGNTCYLQPKFNSAETLGLLESGNISVFMHVPSAYADLIVHNPGQSYDLSQVRLFISGSSFLPPKIWELFKDRFGHEIVERYAASEMGLVATNILSDRQPGSVGYPPGDVDVKIMSNGEVAIRSPGVFSGYWQADATSQQLTPDGYWRSGDLGRIDDAGRLWLKGRLQERLIKSGYVVSPRDIEWALMQHGAVREAVVMGVHHEDKLNDRFVYFVVGDITKLEIISYARKAMPQYWRPDKIILLPAIPKSGQTRKLDLRKLRAIIDQEMPNW